MAQFAACSGADRQYRPAVLAVLPPEDPLAAEAEAAAWLAQVAAPAGKEHPYRQPRKLEAPR